MARSGDAQPRPIMSKTTGEQIQKARKLGWRLRLRDPKEVGKQPERTFYGSHPEAVIELHGMGQALKKGEVLPLTRGKATIAEAAEIWLRAYQWTGDLGQAHTAPPDRPYSTWHKAKFQLNRYILPRLGPNLRLSALTEQAVANVALQLSNEGYKRSSVQTTVSVMKSMFRDLHTMRITPKNYAANVKGDWSKSLTKEDFIVPTSAEINKLAAALEGQWPGHGPIITFLAFTGLRFEELAALTWADIDYENKVIKVSRSATESGGKRTVSNKLKSKKSTRHIILLSQASQALAELKKAGLLARNDRPLVNEDDWSRIVNNTRGGYISYSQWRKHLSKARHSSGIDITAHELRHTFASRLLVAGISTDLVSQQLGHSSVKITEAVYRHHITVNRSSESIFISEKLRGLIDRKVSPTGEG